MQKKLLLVLSVLLVLLTTVAYSVLSTSLTISGEATIRAIADIRVNGIVLDSASGGTVAYDSKYNKNTITSGFTLPSAGSTISYRVQIDNTGDVDYTIYDILTTSSSNPGLSYTISGYNLQDVIQAKTSVSLVITYSTSQPSDSVINVINTFDFRRVYHVTYNTGTSQTISSQIKYENVDLILTSTEPSKNGYTFSKWNTKSDGTGTNYNAGSTYTLNDDLDLYAMWKADSHTVTYNTTENGGTGTIAQATVNYGDPITLPSTGASKSGWTFVGWNTDKNATTALSSLNMGIDDVTLYAIYSKTVTATFSDNQGATVASNSANCTYYNNNTSCQVTAPSVTAQSGFSLLGFNTSASATTSDSNYNLSTNKLTISIDGTYYPITRSSSQYSGTFTIQDSNAATKSGGTTSCYRYNGENSCNITAPTLTANTGYTVVGWNETADSTTATYASGGSISMTANATFYSITYYNTPVTITFNRNNPPSKCTRQTPSGGSASSDTSIDQTCTKYNGSNGCSVTSPTMTVTTGYHALGYNTTSAATTSTWAPGTTRSVGSSITMYAITEGNTYSVKFNANCPSGSTASGSMSNQSMTYGVSANLTNNAYSCTGHIFAGWNTTSEETGMDYTNGQSVSNLTYINNGIANLYGKWTKVMAENLSYDNTLTGVNCADSQCMIDYLACRIKNEGTCTTTFAIGDYIQMTPNPGTLDAQDRYATDTSKTGYSSVQYIYPKELNLWRVIKVNGNGTVEMVSEYASSTNVWFGGYELETTGNNTASTIAYKNFVSYLNTLANQYQNPIYTISARHMGYHGQTGILTSKSAYDGTSNTPPWTSSTTSKLNKLPTDEAIGRGDTMYAYDTAPDTGLVQVAYGNQGNSSLIAKQCNDTRCSNPTTAANYWLASRYYYYNGSNNFRFYGRYITIYGSLHQVDTRYFYGGNWNDYYPSLALRPIVTLKSGVTVASGTGTKTDPFILN